MVGVLLRPGEHHRDRLPVPVNAAVLHDGQVVAGHSFHRFAEERRRRLHRRSVLVGHDENHAGSGLGRGRVQRRDPASGDGAVRERGVDHAFHREFGREAGGSPDLERAVKPRHRGTGQALLVPDQRVGCSAWSPAVGP
jgi:hypothetical protein